MGYYVVNGLLCRGRVTMMAVQIVSCTCTFVFAPLLPTISWHGTRPTFQDWRCWLTRSEETTTESCPPGRWRGRRSWGCVCSTAPWTSSWPRARGSWGRQTSALDSDPQWRERELCQRPAIGGTLHSSCCSGRRIVDVKIQCTDGCHEQGHTCYLNVHYHMLQMGSLLFYRHLESVEYLKRRTVLALFT